MNVLSLFDGMSCGQIALNKLGFKIDNYFASEVDKYAIQIAKKNYPNTKHIGDVTKVDASELPNIDLLIGGSPCQGFSFAGKQLNFNDPRSKLFFEFVRLWKETKPKYFLLENVRMKQESQDVITEILGVEPIEINSALISATARRRIYWTNIPNIQQPAGSPLVLADVLEDLPFDRPCTPRPCTYKSDCYHVATVSDIKGNESIKRVYCPTGKAPTLTTMTGGHREPKITLCGNKYRKLTVLEMERLHGAPENYTAGVSKTQAKKMLGNGWQVDTIAHIFKKYPLMKRIIILVGHSRDTAVRMQVPDHFTEQDARNQYFKGQFELWCDAPVDGDKLPLTEGIEQFFNRVKSMGDSNAVSLGGRRELAARLGISYTRTIHCLATLRKKGHVETKRFNNAYIKGYYLKY